MNVLSEQFIHFPLFNFLKVCRQIASLIRLYRLETWGKDKMKDYGMASVLKAIGI